MLRYSVGQALAAIALCALISGCDNTPSATFKQDMADRDAAQAGDPYASLKNTPRQIWYSRGEPAQRQAFASGGAASLRANYDTLLDKLDKDAKVDNKGELFTKCRPAFAAASAFQQSTERDKAKVTASAETSFAPLKACRAAAGAAKKAGKDTDTAALLSRFASVGMILVGVSCTATGDEQRGMALWREGDDAAAQDEPGFKITVQSFRGW